MCKKTISAFQFFQEFPDNEAARLYIESRFWAGGIICPSCASVNKSTKRPRNEFYRCRSCRKEFSVRTGTVFENSKLPLNKWLYAMYLFVVSRKGVSSLQLSKELGVTQKTAWHLLHRIREACSTSRGKLDGIIEVDETYIGGKERNKHANKRLRAGRGAVGKTAVIGAKERNGNVCAKVIETTDGATLKGFVNNTVEAGSTVYTDEHKGYNGLGRIFYKHGTVKHSAKEYVNGMAHTNGIESVWAVLKRGYHGIYHNWSTKHCQRYVNEFSFRLNEGNVKNSVFSRIDAIIDGAPSRTLPCQMLIRSVNTQ